MFVPMGGDGNGGFVVVVAKDQEGSEGRIPDLTTLKAFTVKNSQGVNYKPNSGVGKDDCEEYWFKKEAEAVGSEGGVAAIVRL
ncbi:hypothetical protein BCR41DRAFT_399614 [Lobosporangium transversale]|uniref:Uncharacterized protein n=1 Tax=Lobosporangium transversale TaxID=64571 RepID=A0A1Y2GDK8_9FUNG|nr:hypothetical protein BCR41DRAFT_399614 [Lobosporangium transversale]ORZ07802.1 hypothetical protein BCR41DRAFT_399614 [Lobosporangium transversale]|eukprot:XP_021878168.1 hypothetical protein BCR41DRAFT_399614 [Lobosporangium transversale]